MFQIHSHTTKSWILLECSASQSQFTIFDASWEDQGTAKENTPRDYYYSPIMYRRSLGCLLVKQSTGRTVVRDPRKAKAAKKTNVLQTLESAPESPLVPEAPPPPPRPTGPLPFNPSLDGGGSRQSSTVGRMLASYAIAGMAVSLGVGIVRLFIG